MLQTRADLEAELISRLMKANNSATFPASRITELVQQAYLWAGSLFFWPSLQKARYTTAVKNTQSLAYDYYDYPSDFLTNSIARLYIDGKKYEKKSFQTLLDYTDQATDNATAPDATKRYFADYGRQFFVYPSYTGQATSNNLIVWGNIQPIQLTTAGSTTIFSLWNDAGNEAIVQKAFSVAMNRLEAQVAAQAKQEAMQTLQVMYQKVVTEQQKEQPLQHPQFNVPNFFGGTGTAPIGNFSIEVR